MFSSFSFQGSRLKQSGCVLLNLPLDCAENRFVRRETDREVISLIECSMFHGRITLLSQDLLDCHKHNTQFFYLHIFRGLVRKKYRIFYSKFTIDIDNQYLTHIAANLTVMNVFVGYHFFCFQFVYYRFSFGEGLGALFLRQYRDGLVFHSVESIAWR